MSQDGSGRVPPHDLDAEASTLGAIFLRNEAIDEVIDRGVRVEDFYLPTNRIIFEAMVDLHTNHTPIDIITVSDRIKQLSPRTTVSEGVLVDLAARVPTAANVGYYARIVHDKGRRRGLIAICGEYTGKAFGNETETDALLDRAGAAVCRLGEDTNRPTCSTMRELALEATTVIQKRHERGATVTGVATGYHDLDSLLAGLQPGDLIVIAARPSVGKAQPDDAQVLTIAGWREIGTLQVGDELASPGGIGSRSFVTGVFPQGERQVYRVTFNDGRSTECCDEHLWAVQHRSWRGPRVMSLASVRGLLRSKRNQGRLWIDTAPGNWGHDEPLPLHSWALGALLGDGDLTQMSPRFSTADKELLDRLIACCPGTESRHAGGCDYRIVNAVGFRGRRGGGHAKNIVAEALRNLGLYGTICSTKFIPRCYLTANRQARLDLLRGLLDTDGTVGSKNGNMSFCTVSGRLCNDVVELARSLGAVVRVHSRVTSYSYNGKYCLGAISYTVSISYARPSDLFTLSRKLRAVRGRQRQPRLVLKSIEPTRRASTRCIRVSHPNHLYVTDEYVLTHNTAFFLNISRRCGVPTLMFSMEMKKLGLTERMIACESGIAGMRIRNGRLAAQEWGFLTQAMATISEMPITIDDAKHQTLLTIRSRARRWRAETGKPDENGERKGLIGLDYLQLIDFEQQNGENRDRAIGRGTAALKELAYDLDVPVVVLSQLNRNLEAREDKRPNLGDLRESGSIEQDADEVIFLHREVPNKKRKKDEPPPDERMMEAILAKQRNGPTGVVDLFFDKAYGRIESASPRRQEQDEMPEPPQDRLHRMGLGE